MGPVTLSSFETSRLVLSRTGLQASTELTRTIEHVLELTARTLHVARVSVWLFDADDQTLHCASLFERELSRFSAGQKLDTATWPDYLAALRSRKFIAADDAQHDLRTTQLAESYLVPLGITSMLDAPLFREGRVVGVVCHEHTGPAREWSNADVEFASSVSDMLTAIFEQAARLDAEEKLREVQTQQARADRMEALGRLAAGVAHDFNGLLMATVTTAESFRRSSLVPPDLAAQATDLLRTVEVAKRLIAQLLLFSRSESGAVEDLNVSEVLHAMRPVFDTMHTAKIELHVPSEPVFSQIDRSRFEQVVLNLVLNASEVSPPGGVVDLALSVETKDGARWVVLKVTDRGPGIALEIVDHIFDPFFSTRPDGTGMGLTTVRAIVEQVGGDISVVSGIGQGATFVVRLRG